MKREISPHEERGRSRSPNRKGKEGVSKGEAARDASQERKENKGSVIYPEDHCRPCYRAGRAANHNYGTCQYWKDARWGANRARSATPKGWGGRGGAKGATQE